MPVDVLLALQRKVVIWRKRATESNPEMLPLIKKEHTTETVSVH
jgi:hypothetical protein